MVQSGSHCMAVQINRQKLFGFISTCTHIAISMELVLEVSVQISSYAARSSWASILVPISVSCVGENEAVRVGDRNEDNVDIIQNVSKFIIVLDNLVNDVNCSHGCEPFSN